MSTRQEKATVFDVADYILNKIESTTTMKLQKLVFYSQAWALAWDEEPLFNEDFQAWANGPVCKELFEAHRGKYVVDKNSFKDKKSGYEFLDKEKATIDSIIEAYADKEAYWLSELTHKERPWIEARGRCKDGDFCNTVIEKDNMQAYYGGLI